MIKQYTGNRTCITCNNMYPATIDYFEGRRNGKKYEQGIKYLSTKCRPCLNKYRKEYWDNNKERRAEHNKKTRNKRKKAGQCKSCHKPLMSSGRCELHWFSGIGANAGFSDNLRTAKLLKRLLEKQNYRCPYTGDILIPGINCSLDHIKPKSRYPELSLDLSNLEWTTIKVNRSKSDMTKEEYYRFIQNILSNKSGDHITPITID